MSESQKKDDQSREGRTLPLRETGLARVESAPPSFAIPIPSLEEEPPHLKEYLRILRRYAWVSLTCFLLTVLATVIATFTQPPVYTATATVKIEPEEPRVVNYKQVASGSGILGREDYYKTQYEILKSRALAQKVIDRLGLVELPERQPGQGKKLGTGLREWLVGLGVPWFQRPPPAETEEPIWTLQQDGEYHIVRQSDKNTSMRRRHAQSRG
ncbi:MAG: hypothetical protein HY347_09045, partial [candidate division NC10 bacterium]|nr:hypothetical protein [candidate division NC10 bacterium]